MAGKFHAAFDDEGVLQKMMTHYLPEEARDPEWDGVIALCDLRAGIVDPDDVPRQATLASRVEMEVDCPDCLRLMA